MSSIDLKLVRRTVVSVKEFFVPGVNGVSEALIECNDLGYSHLFMPDLAIARTNVDKYHRSWQKWYLAPSVRVTGRTKGGHNVVVYGHVPNYFSNPDNINEAVGSGRIVNGAGVMPWKDFYSLLGQEGSGSVFVVDHVTLIRSSSGIIKVDDALDHPQTIPFLGGEEIAIAYLKKHKEVHGPDIGIWHADDFSLDPLARLLYVGDDYFDALSGGDLSGDGCVLGFAPEEHVRQKISEVQLEHRVE